jgi:hypothetical protein
MHQSNKYGRARIALAATMFIVPFATAANATDINAVERFMEQIARDGHLQLCQEPFYPPGECGIARFTAGMRYHWIHATDARSNENLAMIHDTQRSGSAPVFYSAIPGYEAMRFGGLDADIWCMPEERLNLPRRYHARITGFNEDGYFRGSRELTSYGLYLVADTQEQCRNLVAAGRDILG